MNELSNLKTRQTMEDVWWVALAEEVTNNYYSAHTTPQIFFPFFFCILNAFKKNKLFFLFFKLFFYIFLDHFNTLISKIIFFKKKLLF